LSHFVLVDHSGEGHEAFLDVGVGLDGGTEILNLMLAAPLHDFCLTDPPLEIALVAQQHYDSLIGLGSADVVPLLFDVFERSLAAQVEHHEHPMAPLEVGGHDRSVFFLAGCVPDIQFGWFIFESDVFHLEVDGGDLGVFFCKEVSFGESPEESGFSNIAVTDDDYLVFFLVLVHGQIPVFYHYYINQQ
jgi:hypothetical protein